MSKLIPKLMSSKKDQPSNPQNASSRKLSIVTSDQHKNNDNQSSSTHTTTTQKPIVKSPDWQIMFDPSLSVYYYFNKKTNETQFDHPDEVVSPLPSPVTKQDSCNSMHFILNSDGTTSSTNNNTSCLDQLSPSEHRKSLFTGNSLKRSLSPRFFGSSSRKNSCSGTTKTTSPKGSKSSNRHSDTSSAHDDESSFYDEDVEEFKKQLDMELQNYEIERLKSP